MVRTLRRSTLVIPAFLLLVLGLCGTGLEAKENEVARIERLLRVVAVSRTSFVLDGTVYSAEEMARHLRDKMAKSDKKNLTADDFISRIANCSSHGGKPYRVVLENGRTTYAGPWLRGLLHDIENGRFQAQEGTAATPPANP